MVKSPHWVVNGNVGVAHIVYICTYTHIGMYIIFAYVCVCMGLCMCVYVFIYTAIHIRLNDDRPAVAVLVANVVKPRSNEYPCNYK